MARRSIEERRQQYLDIGAEIIAESFDEVGKDPALALSHVKMAEVAERAGVTKGALYHIWESQEAFWMDLLDRLLDLNSLFWTDYLEGLLARDSSQLSHVPTMYDHADAMFGAISVHPMLFARVGLVSYLSDEAVRRQFDDQYKAALAGYRGSLEFALKTMGRRLKPEFQLEDVLVTIDAILEGLCLNSRLTTERAPSVHLPNGMHASLYAVALEAVVIGYTEPIDSDDKEQPPLGIMSDIPVCIAGDNGQITSFDNAEAAIDFWSSRATAGTDSTDVTAS